MEIDFSQGHTVYLIDTSGLIKLESTFKPENPVYAAVWEEIEDLIKQGFFKTIDFVEIEINEYEGKDKSNKIPAVAKKHGVRCIDVDVFLMERGLKMERKKISK